MFEKKDEPMIPFPKFLLRLSISFCIGIGILLLALCVGVIGFTQIEALDWISAFENSAMILSTMGPVVIMKTSSGKLFSAFYALFSGLVFITMMGVIFAPVVHRLLHKFHTNHGHK